ncbi:MAG: hypothetical protein P4M07_22185 [Xanthobacteraceae bacterium]|nr:hypothetical protein [Xanthobacteraceae bacterium]
MFAIDEWCQMSQTSLKEVVKGASLFAIFLAAAASGSSAQTVVPATPFSMSVFTISGPINLVVPVVPGKYFYLSDISVTGDGGISASSSSNVARISYYGLLNGSAPDDIVPLGAVRQIDFHRAFSNPWQSTDAGITPVGISVDPVISVNGGGGNIVARVIGFYR